MSPQSPHQRRAEAAALLALDAVDDSERMLLERDAGREDLHDLQQVTAFLADAAAEDPPADLREQVLTAARARRAPGRPVRDKEPLTPAEAFAQTVEELHALMIRLGDDEWSAPTLTAYGRARDLVAHLAGVEENLLGILGVGPRPDPETWPDHVKATAPVVAALSGTPVASVVDRWVRAARRLAEVAAMAPQDDMIAVNDIPASVSGMFVLRTFEVWTHHEDLCRATGRPLPNLDPDRLRLMSGELMRVLPIALTLQGNGRPGRTVRLVLNGPGGGTYDLPMAPDSTVGVPDAIITTDVVDLCRVASRRIAPDDLAATVAGSEALAGLVLQAAGAFARD